MQADSRPVSSNQHFTHPGLPDKVLRHLASPSRKPVAAHNQAAFKLLATRRAEHGGPLVLDSFCGTGMSTALLAERHPDHLVIGIDKSSHRLDRHTGGDPDNYLLLRAECEAIWCLMLAQGWRVDFHYLLYPNPWPKSSHLGRRVHGDPAFPHLLQLGGQVELRSNWQVYVEEFGLAMTLGGASGFVARCPDDAPPVTLFEHKYRSSGHALWCYRGHCPAE